MGSRDRSRSPAGALSTDEILRMITQREHARQAKDFGQADSIRETLRGSGVEVFDKTMNWRAQDGRTGRIPTFQEIESGAALQSSGGSALSTQEIVSLIFQRETARKANDYAQADSIRDQLKAGGVEMFEKTKQWKTTDGRSGTIPTWQEIEAGSSIDHHVERVQDGSGASSIDPNDPLGGIKQLVMQRESARSAKDFQEADRIREELRQQSVEIFDKEKLWKRTSDGAAGVVIGYREDGTCTDQEIQILVLQRERARQEKQWPVSDMIRDELRLRGVAIFDKEKRWTANDGRQGAVPVWNGTNGVVMQPMPAGAPMMHRHTPVYPPRSIPTAFAGGANNLQTLQNQIVQEALRHAQNPVAAQQTLQRLRSGGGNAQMQAARPTSSRPVKAEPTPSASPDVRDALTFCQNSQGRTLAEEEIMWLLETRERCRSISDYASADALRNAMKSLGLELMEKQKIWSTSDGRSGAIPAWESLK